MANQNAVENALSTTTDSEQQGDQNDATTEVAADSNDDFNAAALDSVDPDLAADADEDDSDADEDSDSAPAPQSAPAYSAPAPSRSQGELVEALTPVGEQDAERKEVEGGRPYEIVFIVRTTHSADIEPLTTRVREMIEGAEGAVDNTRTSDVRRFSYPIDKENEGSYVVLNARFKTGTVADLDRFFKLEEGVVRHLIVREDI